MVKRRALLAGVGSIGALALVASLAIYSSGKRGHRKSPIG